MTVNINNPIIQQAGQDVIQAAETLSVAIQSYRKRPDIARLLSADSKLTKTVDDLVENLSQVANGIASAGPVVDPLKNINSNAAKLLEVTRTWATLRDALDQRNGKQPFLTRLLIALKLPEPMKTNEDSLINAIAIGDQVVIEFYKIAHEKNLSLRVPDVELATVLREDRIHSEAFGEPTPFIVGPLWGYNQAWNYISYAHEVGHHIYRNVDGLDCELLVNLMLTLGARGYSRSQVRNWGAWLEEIFADLFCLFRVGPAAIHAGQRVALWLGATSSRIPQSSDSLTQILLTSRDFSHPVPYLRIRIGLEVLKLLQEDGPDDKELKEQVDELEVRWEDLAERPTNVYINDRKEESASVLDTGRVVLNIILNTPLYALADKGGGSSSGARSILDVFYDASRFKPKAVDDLRQIILANMNDQGPTVDLPSEKEAKWHILAAAEFARDKLHEEKSLQNLHDKTVKLLEQ